MITARSLILPTLLIAAPTLAATEDLTTYTEVDANSKISVTADRVTWAGTGNGETSYVYDDKGAGHFSGDFAHRFLLRMGSSSAYWAWIGAYCLSTHVGTISGMAGAGADAVAIRPRRVSSSEYRIYLYLYEAGSGTSDVWSGAAGDTVYYVTVSRDDDAGANSTGRYTCTICTGNYYGESGASLQDTLTLDSSAGEQNDFRYVYAVTGNGNGEDYYASYGYLEDLDLQETTPSGAPPQIF